MALRPTKSDFYFGRRFSRLFPQARTQSREANSNGASQELLQHLSGIHRIHIPLAPILCFWNLRIQHRAVLSDVFALFAADFFFDFCIPSAFGNVKHIKINAVSLALGFCQKSVFLFRAGADANIMLRYTHQHIFALPESTSYSSSSVSSASMTAEDLTTAKMFCFWASFWASASKNAL